MSYRQNNPAGISASIEQWTHQDLVTWISWEVIRSITSNQTLESAMFKVPHVVIQWHQHQEKLRAEEAKKLTKGRS